MIALKHLGCQPTKTAGSTEKDAIERVKGFKTEQPLSESESGCCFYQGVLLG
jgi:hypothetical protein